MIKVFFVEIESSSVDYSSGKSYERLTLASKRFSNSSQLGVGTRVCSFQRWNTQLKATISPTDPLTSRLIGILW